MPRRVWAKLIPKGHVVKAHSFEGRAPSTRQEELEVTHTARVRLPTVGFSGYTIKNSINETVVVYPQFTYGLIDQVASFNMPPFSTKTFSLIDGTQDEWESF